MRLLRSLSTLLALVVVVAALFVSRPALAQKAEKDARALQKKAMEEDYLGTEFAAAQQKLDKAIAACGADKCPPQLRAQLRRDLGVVFIGGQIDKDKGQAAFIEALKIDPTVALDPDLKTKELETAFEAARKKLASGGGGKEPTASGGGGAIAGDFTHTPHPEGLVRTDYPIYAEYAGSDPIVKAMVRYKSFGMSEFKPLELKKVGGGWGVYIPHGDVQQGTLQYYIQGFNRENDPIATAGDRNNTYKVAIKAKIAGAPPALPGQPPPQQVADTADCPGPEFPCWAILHPKGEVKPTTNKDGKIEGADCEESSECFSLECKNGKCGAAVEGPTAHKKLWLGVGLNTGFALLQAGSDVCKLSDKQIPANSPGYYCFADGRDYPSRGDQGAENNLLDGGKAGSIDGGFSPSSTRVLASIDYALKSNVMLGARVGFVANNVYPGQEAQKDAKSNNFLARIHLEARFTYLFGKDAINKTAPFVFIAGGLSEFHGSVEVPVAETGQNQNKKVTAYLIGGPAFAGIGAGPRIKVGSNAAILLGPRVDLAIGYVGVLPVFGLEGAVQFGL